MSRRRYAAWGFSLAAAKYGIDAAVFYFALGIFWRPLQYFDPMGGSRIPAEATRSSMLMLPLGLAIWSLPFVWVGLAFTFRRTVDAGRSPWLTLVYFVPLANYLFLVALCLLPTKLVVEGAATYDRREWRPFVAEALRGIVTAVTVAVGAVVLSVYVLHAYGAALFLGTPVVVGAVLGYLLNRPHVRPLSTTLGIVSMSILLSGAALLLFALEGVLCLSMAAPIALVCGALGAVVGRAIAELGPGPPYHSLVVLAALPFLAGFESATIARPERREVVSSIEIDAPSEKVWPLVLGFAELPAPTEAIFRAGIAYPVRAHIEGEGVGAVRYCEFSTGPFVEPITQFAPPTRLSFDVRSQPLPMKELSPYGIHPPHLDGYFRSVAGEFRLFRLEGGRTRVEGSTWYELDMAPAAYWTPLADWLIHAIHLRVLSHIRVLATT